MLTCMDQKTQHSGCPPTLCASCRYRCRESPVITPCFPPERTQSHSLVLGRFSALIQVVSGLAGLFQAQPDSLMGEIQGARGPECRDQGNCVVQVPNL